MNKALLFAALAISVKASAQNLPSISGMHHQISNIKETLHEGTEDVLVNKYGTIHHQVPEPLTSVRQNDSIYNWRWDWNIIGWTIESRIINMDYDPNNNLTFFTSQTWDGSAWVNDYQNIYTYDAKNNLIKRSAQYWDGSTWVNSPVQYTYTYDDHNNKTSELLVGASHFSYSFIWNYDAKDNKTSELYSSIFGSYSFTWTYDARKNKESEVYEGLSGNYSDKYKWIYHYNSRNDRTLETHRDWKGNDWVVDYQYRHIYTYDTKNNKTKEVVQYAVGNNFFVNSDQFTYTYDEKKNLTIEIKQHWENDQWQNIYKYAYTYDGNKNQINKYTGAWLGSGWVYYLQDIRAFDSGKNLISHIYQELSESTWKIVDQWLYTYEADDFKSSESYKHFDFNDPGIVVSSGDSTHYYSRTITVVKEVKADDDNFNVYPNPSSGKFTVTSKCAISAIEIYNLLGERVYSDSKFDSQTSKEIDLSDLGKGIYIVNIYDGKLMYCRKVVVQ